MGINMFQFKKPHNELELILKQGKKQTPSVPDAMFTHCPSCNTSILSDELSENANICTKCGFHFYMNARLRIHLIADEGSFAEINEDLQSSNVIDFPDYESKLQHAKLATSENEAVVTGFCTIEGNPCALFVMEGSFMMGSMGTVVGEKITRLFEAAAEKGLPVVGFTVSGGARMQEGIMSLMQMAKTSSAVAKHNKAGLLYITVLTNPTTGGVTASFAMEGDIILSEPGALICFAGPRVIAQTTRQKLPQGFQKAEFLMDKGFIDAIVPRPDQKKTIGKLLRMHR
jgi:acetyl-CoA carboxylase carboxyl transferase subunit beta